MRWLLALLALLVPPIALLWRPDGAVPRGALLAAVLWIAGIAVFFLLSWGVGAILVAVSGLVAALAVVRK
jgi:hypothetical protein